MEFWCFILSAPIVFFVCEIEAMWRESGKAVLFNNDELKTLKHSELQNDEVADIADLIYCVRYFNVPKEMRPHPHDLETILEDIDNQIFGKIVRFIGVN